jgi:hypothetical protein
MRRAPIWPVVAGALVAGFAVAQLSGVRPLGGAVLLAGAVWAARLGRERAGWPRTAAVLLVSVVAFAASHALADAIGAWPAVAVAAAVAGGAAWALLDASGRPSRARRRPASAAGR